MLLLDEPLGSLDRPLRERLIDELIELFERLSLTVDARHARRGRGVRTRHRVAVMRNGRVVQHATPDGLWMRPADEWVARFLGMTNVREFGRPQRPHPAEAVRVTPGEGAVVVAVQRRGAAVWLRLRLDDGKELDAVTTALDHPRVGDRVRVESTQSGSSSSNAEGCSRPREALEEMVGETIRVPPLGCDAQLGAPQG